MIQIICCVFQEQYMRFIYFFYHFERMDKSGEIFVSWATVNKHYNCLTPEQNKKKCLGLGV